MEEYIANVTADIDREAEGDLAYYQVFLMRTDELALRAMEEYIVNGTKTSVKNEYGEVLEARAYARERIKELEDE